MIESEKQMKYKNTNSAGEYVVRTAAEEEVAADADIAERHAFATVVNRRVRPHQLVDHLPHLVHSRHLHSVCLEEVQKEKNGSAQLLQTRPPFFYLLSGFIRLFQLVIDLVSFD